MRKGCLGALFAGGALAGVVGAALLGVLLLLGGILSAVGLGSESAAGAATPSVPPMASAQTLPAEWLPLMAEEDPGIPNSLVAALMAAGSGGQGPQALMPQSRVLWVGRSRKGCRATDPSRSL
jgi:hypothetical protein